jgi:hypothetical protein
MVLISLINTYAAIVGLILLQLKSAIQPRGRFRSRTPKPEDR